jgi:hypothetical protein
MLGAGEMIMEGRAFLCTNEHLSLAGGAAPIVNLTRQPKHSGTMRGIRIAPAFFVLDNP